MPNHLNYALPVASAIVSASVVPTCFVIKSLNHLRFQQRFEFDESSLSAVHFLIWKWLFQRGAFWRTVFLSFYSMKALFLLNNRLTLNHVNFLGLRRYRTWFLESLPTKACKSLSPFFLIINVFFLILIQFHILFRCVLIVFLDVFRKILVVFTVMSITSGV